MASPKSYDAPESAQAPHLCRGICLWTAAGRSAPPAGGTPEYGTGRTVARRLVCLDQGCAAGLHHLGAIRTAPGAPHRQSIPRRRTGCAPPWVVLTHGAGGVWHLWLSHDRALWRGEQAAHLSV